MWSDEGQHSAAPEIGEAMEGKENLSCFTSTGKGNTRENVALLLNEEQETS